MWRRLLVRRTASIALFVVASLFDAFGAHPTLAQSTDVFIYNYGFYPSTITVPVGTTITWVHQAGSTPHTTTSDSTGTDQWSSAVLNGGDTYSHTFNTPGTFHYHCAIHASMTATVIVQAATPDTLAVPMSSGWDLLAIPLHMASVNSTEDLAGALDAQLGANTTLAVATYDSGLFGLYVPHYSTPQPLSSGQGVFAFNSAGGTWRPSGKDFTSSQPVTLQPGWNLSAAPVPTAGLQTTAIASEIGPPGTVHEIATFANGAYHTWTPGQPAFLVPASSGMWILCNCSPNTDWQPGSP